MAPLRTTIADPGPMGLASLAVTTFVLSVHQAGWAPDLAWLGLGLFHGGLVQLLAGMWEFTRGGVFGATAFSTYGALWIGQSIFVLLSLANLIPAGISVSTALGWFLAGFFVFNSYMLVCSTMVSKAIFAVFCGLELTLLTSFIASFTAAHGWQVASGVVGLLTAIIGWYASCALCFNALAGRQVMFIGAPLLRFDGEATRPAPAAGDVEDKDTV